MLACNFLRGAKGRLAVAALASAGLFGTTSGAVADAITFGPSGQAITFRGNGAGGISVSSYSISGPALFDQNLIDQISHGKFTLSPLSLKLGAENNNEFSVLKQAAEAFSFVAGRDRLKGKVSFTSVEDNGRQAIFQGTLTITSVAGPAAFLADFSRGQTQAFDFTTTTFAPMTLSNLALTHRSERVRISFGDPEPVASVPGPIVGAGLPGLIAACAGLLVLGRRRRQQIA